MSPATISQMGNVYGEVSGHFGYPTRFSVQSLPGRERYFRPAVTRVEKQMFDDRPRQSWLFARWRLVTRLLGLGHVVLPEDQLVANNVPALHSTGELITFE